MKVEIARRHEWPRGRKIRATVVAVVKKDRVLNDVDFTLHALSRDTRKKFMGPVDGPGRLANVSAVSRARASRERREREHGEQRSAVA